MVNKLLEIHEDHGTIIVGVDFDDTIFKYSEDKSELECSLLRKTLRKAIKKEVITLCLYTIADVESLKYKVALMKEWGIFPHFINESPVKLGDGRKPYFNLLLDDKAGLAETTEVLMAFLNKVTP